MSLFGKANRSSSTRPLSLQPSSSLPGAGETLNIKVYSEPEEVSGHLESPLASPGDPEKDLSWLGQEMSRERAGSHSVIRCYKLQGGSQVLPKPGTLGRPSNAFDLTRKSTKFPDMKVSQSFLFSI